MPPRRAEKWILTDVGTAMQYTPTCDVGDWPIKTIVLHNADSADPVVDAVIQGSMDGIVWTTLNSTFADGLAAGGQAAVTITDAWRYIRVGVQAADANPLSTVNVYGAAHSYR